MSGHCEITRGSPCTCKWSGAYLLKVDPACPEKDRHMLEWHRFEAEELAAKLEKP